MGTTMKSVWFVLAIAMASGQSDPLAAADANAGEQIAARVCAGCHGIGAAKGVMVQGVFVPSFSEIAQRPNRSRERMAAFIMMPHRPMPGLPLQESEVAHVVEYILSLK